MEFKICLVLKKKVIKNKKWWDYTQPLSLARALNTQLT
jgi:hypothetical protein